MHLHDSFLILLLSDCIITEWDGKVNGGGSFLLYCPKNHIDFISVARYNILDNFGREDYNIYEAREKAEDRYYWIWAFRLVASV